ncbi:MAG: hypothetical protein CL843_11325 [Crocinitomicaceae bacterium]|nr:hypothetical protein [Crocinitomicaceae bacterium]|tara:strand:- start:9417 stop:10136 length:720 start_codon:yes stop_codon:yes gene_type:complete
MKQILPLFILALMSIKSMAQFDFEYDTIELSLAYNELRHINLVIDNSQSTSDLDYKWTETYRDLNPNWEVQFCDCRTCYSDYHLIPEDTSITCEGMTYGILAGQSSTYIFYVNPFDVEDEGFLSVNFRGINGNDEIGDITFRARFTPASVSEQVKQNLGFKIFPNPVKDYTNISFNAEGLQTVQLRIVDVLGKEVATAILPGGNTLYSLNSSEFQSGVYFVQLLMDSGDVLSTQKLVVQ